MKRKSWSKPITALALALLVAGMWGCDDVSSPTNPTEVQQSNSVNLTGHVSLDNVKAHNITIEAAGISVHPDANGNYAIVGTRAKAARFIAARSLADTVKPMVNIIVNDTDTLRSIPVTSWSGVLPTSYVVQRNVSVTLPVKYAGMDVIVGYFNTTLNPGTYASVTLGRYSWVNNSGFIYSAYDSAAYANASYLYSAVAIVKHKDSVVAFSNVIDTVTAKVGNIGFDSGVFIGSLRTDSAFMRPWWTSEIPNGTNILLVKGKDVVISRDSTMKFDTTVHVTGTIKLDSISSSAVLIKVGSLSAHPGVDGKFSIADTGIVTGRINDSIVGRAYIIANGHDTVSIVDLKSWTSDIGTRFVTQRNLSVVLPSTYSKSEITLGLFNSAKNSGTYRAFTGTAASLRRVCLAYDSASYFASPYLYTATLYVRDAGKVTAFSTTIDTVKVNGGSLNFDSASFVTELRTDSTLVKKPWWSGFIQNGANVSDSTNKVLHLTLFSKVDTIVLDTFSGNCYNDNYFAPYVGSHAMYDTNGNSQVGIPWASDSVLSKKIIAGMDTSFLSGSDTAWRVGVVTNVVLGMSVSDDSSNATIRILGRSTHVNIDFPNKGITYLTLDFSKFIPDTSVYVSGYSPYETYIPVLASNLSLKVVRKTTTAVYK